MRRWGHVGATRRDQYAARTRLESRVPRARAAQSSFSGRTTRGSPGAPVSCCISASERLRRPRRGRRARARRSRVAGQRGVRDSRRRVSGLLLAERPQVRRLRRGQRLSRNSSCSSLGRAARLIEEARARALGPAFGAPTGCLLRASRRARGFARRGAFVLVRLSAAIFLYVFYKAQS